MRVQQAIAMAKFFQVDAAGKNCIIQFPHARAARIIVPLCVCVRVFPCSYEKEDVCRMCNAHARRVCKFRVVYVSRHCA